MFSLALTAALRVRSAGRSPAQSASATHRAVRQDVSFFDTVSWCTDSKSMHTLLIIKQRIFSAYK